MQQRQLTGTPKRPVTGGGAAVTAAAADAADGSGWVTLVGDRAHVGFNASHIVRELVTGCEYSFRVGLIVDRGDGARTSAGVGAGGGAGAGAGAGAGGRAGDGSTGSPAAQVKRWSQPSDPFAAGYADVSLVAPNARTVVGGADFTPDEIAFFMTLDHPGKVQDYLDSFPLNHEAEDDTCLSALEAVRNAAAAQSHSRTAA